MDSWFLRHFDSITVPRIARHKNHNLLAIHLLAISTVISVDEGWKGFEDFGHLKLD
jgi:hypothetical protein